MLLYLPAMCTPYRTRAEHPAHRGAQLVKEGRGEAGSYTPILPEDIAATAMPAPREPDGYLRSRLDQFSADVQVPPPAAGAVGALGLGLRAGVLQRCTRLPPPPLLRRCPGAPPGCGGGGGLALLRCTRLPEP